MPKQLRKELGSLGKIQKTQDINSLLKATEVETGELNNLAARPASGSS